MASRAYARIVLVDENGNEISGNDQKTLVPTGANTWKSLSLTLEASEAGYAVVYVANESKMDVFFDEIEVQHERLVWQENAYYPFGLAIKPLEREGRPDHRFTYNGKELEENTAWYDYDARQMDGQTGRFTSIDPHAENYYGWTPYNYVGGNPINLTDPGGKDWYSDKDGNTLWVDSDADEYIGDDSHVYHNIGKSLVQETEYGYLLYANSNDPVGIITTGDESDEATVEGEDMTDADWGVVFLGGSGDDASHLRHAKDNNTTELFEGFTDLMKLLGNSHRDNRNRLNLSQGKKQSKKSKGMWLKQKKLKQHLAKNLTKMRQRGYSAAVGGYSKPRADTVGGLKHYPVHEGNVIYYDIDSIYYRRMLSTDIYGAQRIDTTHQKMKGDKWRPTGK